ncbi:MAG: hypothetical protein KAS71_05975 [Bacteroidales bacterium]|nr:hypothetical protein [Bacteroidales bacterium]
MFFRLILFIILGYVIIGFFKRLFAIPKTKSQYHDPKSSKEKEGNVTIKNAVTKKQEINKSEGDYIDFEDV